MNKKTKTILTSLLTLNLLLVTVTSARAKTLNSNNCHNTSIMKGIAHRGYSSIAPENTLPSYILAKEKGFSFVECDISWTKDGVPVLLHDNKIDRTSNGTGLITSMTLKTVRTYDFGSWKNKEYKGTVIPTFKEFISLCKDLKLHPYIELKGEITPLQANRLLQIVRESGMINNVTWISFSKKNLIEINRLNLHARLGYLGGISSSFIADAKTLKTPVNEVFIDVEASTPTPSLVQKSFEAGIPVEVWLINDAQKALKIGQYGISGITSDNLNASEFPKTFLLSTENYLNKINAPFNQR